MDPNENCADSRDKLLCDIASQLRQQRQGLVFVATVEQRHLTFILGEFCEYTIGVGKTPDRCDLVFEFFGGLWVSRTRYTSRTNELAIVADLASRAQWIPVTE